MRTVLNSLLQACRSKSVATPPDDTPKYSAADQVLNKGSKIQSAMEMTLVNGIRRLDQDQRETLQEYQRGKLGMKPLKRGSWLSRLFGGGADDEMLIADNINVDNSRKSGLLGPLLGAGLVIGSGIIGAPYLLPLMGMASQAAQEPSGQQPVPVPPAEDRVFDYDVESRVIPPGQ